MTKRDQLPQDLVAEIVDAGFYPDLVFDAIASALGNQPVVGYLLHHEATLANGEVNRHLTVLVLTENCLLISHTDDGDAGDPNRALTSSEVVALNSINTAVVTRSVASPDRYPDQAQLVETWLSLVWGSTKRLDFGTGGCDDPECTADHGYSGSITPNDLTVRMSPAGDGATSTKKLLEFGTLLQQRIGR